MTFRLSIELNTHLDWNKKRTSAFEVTRRSSKSVSYIECIKSDLVFAGRCETSRVSQFCICECNCWLYCRSYMTRTYSTIIKHASIHHQYNIHVHKHNHSCNKFKYSLLNNIIPLIMSFRLSIELNTHLGGNKKRTSAFEVTRRSSKSVNYLECTKSESKSLRTSRKCGRQRVAGCAKQKCNPFAVDMPRGIHNFSPERVERWQSMRVGVTLKRALASKMLTQRALYRAAACCAWGRCLASKRTFPYIAFARCIAV